MTEALYGALAPYYDRIYGFKDYRAEAGRLRGILERAARRPIHDLLDVGCGTGGHLVEFRRWYHVAGLDLSPAMLRVARRRLGAGTMLRRGDMRSFRLPGPFDALVCLFSAYGYLRTPRDRARAASTFYRHLRPGGVALVEGWILPDAWRRDRELHLLRYDTPELKVARITRSSRVGSMAILRMEYLLAERGGRIRHFREVHRQPLVPGPEQLATFRAAGFRARLIRRGPFHDRGLYVLVRPKVGNAG